MFLQIFISQYLQGQDGRIGVQWYITLRDKEQPSRFVSLCISLIVFVC